MNEAQYTDMHRSTFSRVVDHVNNIGRVNRMEAFDMCMAYTRCFGQLIASMCEHDEEYEDKLRELFDVLHMEGLASRKARAEANHE